MDPALPSRPVTLAFPHSWDAEVLPKRPLIKPLRCFTYPREAEEVERGALEVMVRPAGKGGKFLATFALGFDDPAAPSGLWSCPNVDDLCAISGGYGYIVNTLDPAQFAHVRPVLEVWPVTKHNLLLFVGHYTLMAWGAKGAEWQSPRLSSEGLRIVGTHGNELHGFGWDLQTDRELPFTIDLHTGQRTDPHSG
jgi:hypothetical protein